MTAMTAAAAPIRVFLADHSAPIRERVGAMLTAAGMRVGGGAATPRDCIAAILSSRPDVVVLDVQLEGGSGLEVLKAVRAAAPEVAFVVLSNHSGAAYRTRYLGEGAAGFLDKSAEFDRLVGTVRSARGEAAPQPPRRGA